jgi:hypothetical protein
MTSQQARRHRRIDGFALALTTTAIRTALVAAPACALMAAPAFAAEPGGQAPAQAPRQYAIAGGTLADVLAQYAAATGVQLVFEPAMLAGLRSGGLRGRYTPQEGFEQVPPSARRPPAASTATSPGAAPRPPRPTPP